MPSNQVWLAFLVLLLSGCISPQTYVAPDASSAALDELKLPATKIEVLVEVEFLRNGQPLVAANEELRRHVDQTLLGSGVFTVVADGTSNRIRVLVNNIGDPDDARAKGFKAGLTLGAAGSLLIDIYEFTIQFDDGTGRALREEYRQELHTTIGNVASPFANIQPMTPAQGFAAVVRRALLKFIGLMQSQGHLSQQPAGWSEIVSSTMCLPMEERT